MNSLELAKKLTCSLSERIGISGYEHSLHAELKSLFELMQTETYTDMMGNFYAVKSGKPFYPPQSQASGQLNPGSERKQIMLAAHSDEIGLMVTYIDNRGFLHFTPIGGIDQRTLLYQEVIVFGKEPLIGIVCRVAANKDIPDSKDKQPLEANDLAIDIGCSFETASLKVKPGDIAGIRRSPSLLLNERLAGKALDDRAGIVIMAVCLNELQKLKHAHDIVAVATVQEEVGLRGAQTSSERLMPMLAVAIDVTHAQTLDTKSTVATELGKGPVLSLGPNIHPWVIERLKDAARENRIPYQIQAVPGATGTDARIIQLTGCGIPTALLSVPLRYMHTSVETVALSDIVDSGRLLARFIAALPDDLEDALCS